MHSQASALSAYDMHMGFRIAAIMSNCTHLAWDMSGAVALDDGSPLLRRPKPMPSARSMPLNVRAVPGWLSVGVVELGEITGCMAY